MTFAMEASRAVWRRGIVLIFAILLIVPAHHAFARGANDEFSKARVAFERGQYGKSQQILKRNLKKYPGHGPSLFLMGRLQFRGGNFSRATAYFRQSGKDFIEGEGALDYGLAFYQVKDFREAIAGFSVIRERRLHDVAAYYMGMSHYRLGEYVIAERALSAAKDIPAGKAETRDRVLNELRQRIGQGFLTGPAEVAESPMSTAPVQPPNMSMSYPPRGTMANTPASTRESSSGEAMDNIGVREKQKVRVGGFNVVTPRLKVYRFDEQAGFSGAQKSESSTQGSQLGVSNVYTYFLRPDKNGLQSSLFLGIDGAYVSETVTGRKVKFYSSAGADDGDFFFADESRDDSSGVRGEIKLTPGGTMLFTKDTKLSGSFELFEQYPDFLGDNTAGTRTAVSQITTLAGTTAWSIEGKYKQTLVNGTSNEDDIIGTITAAPSISFMTLEGKFSYKTSQNPTGEVLPGPAGVTGFELKAGKPLDFGITLGLSLGYSVLSDYKVAGLTKAPATTDTGSTTPTTTDTSTATDTTVVGSASGTSNSYSLTLDVAPFDWITGGMSFSSSQNEFSVADSETQASFLQNAPSIESKFSLSLSVQKAF